MLKLFDFSKIDPRKGYWHKKNEDGNTPSTPVTEFILRKERDWKKRSFRFGLQIDRPSNDQPTGHNKSIVVLMKNPSFGSFQSLDPTLRNLVKYVPDAYDQLFCINTTAVSTSKAADLENKIELMQQWKKANTEFILEQLRALSSDNGIDLLLATGALENKGLPYKRLLFTYYNDLLTAILEQNLSIQYYRINSTRIKYGNEGCHPGFFTPKELPLDQKSPDHRPHLTPSKEYYWHELSKGDLIENTKKSLELIKTFFVPY